MRHTPASPNVMRRTQQIAQNYQAEQYERKQRQEATIAQSKQTSTASTFSPKNDAPTVENLLHHSSPLTQEKPKASGIYAKPQINLGTSSFKQSGHGILSQIAKRINPNKNQSQQQELIYNDDLTQKSSNNGEYPEATAKNNEQHFTSDDYISTDRPTTHAGSVMTKTNAGFLENLNQKLAEHRLSGKAYAVRNYINKNTLVGNSFYIDII